MEEESFFELRKILPSEWVIREKPKDYGVDAEVEIFDSDGTYTGIVFWIQLKATDSSKISDHKSLRMPIAKIKQLVSYDLSVAIFRYNSKGKEFFFDWIFRHNIISIDSDKKSFNLKFQDHHLWSEDSPNHIKSFLLKKNKYSDGSFFFPIKGFVNNINVPKRIARKLSSKITKKISLINIVRDKYLADVEINLLENKIVLILYGSFGSSIKFEKKSIDNEEVIFRNFEIGLLLMLHHARKYDDMIKFVNDNELFDELVTQNGMLEYLLPRLIVSENDYNFTEAIIHHVFKTKDVRRAYMLQTITALSSDGLISQDRVASYFNQIIEHSLDPQDDTFLSGAFYALAAYYKRNKVLNRALEYYNKAIKTTPSLLNIGFFCCDLADVLFGLGRFKLSTRFYKKAIELEPKNILLLASLGDSEFYSGNFENANHYYDDFLSLNVESFQKQMEVTLKFAACDALINFYGINSQKRDNKKSNQILESLSEKELQKPSNLDMLINIDALNPDVWVYYSALYLQKKNIKMVFVSSLIDALLTKINARSWANLIIWTNYKEVPTELINALVNTGYFYCKEDFISELQELIDLIGHSLGDKFLNVVESLIFIQEKDPSGLFYDNDDDDDDDDDDII
ncbi:DUF4365 domain-containing protein [Maribacter sedimenticola]|uniref:DUF4365 domain-containing protein n=1 Tax=Maribacter sedimenticola TaxID=228956 RepID=UPI00117F3741|nr:DUF4365 domain-containing protein [Maribacter sedimenticola]